MQLISVKNENGKQLVSARELHEFLEVKSRFNDWIERRVEKYDFIENVDFTAITQKKVTAQGNSYDETDYIITIDMAKELSMVENNDKGKQARRYFIECEKQLREKVEYKQKSLDTPYDYLDNNAKALNGFLTTFGLNIPKEIVAHTVVESARKQTGYDFEEVKSLLNKQEEEIYHTKKEVCMRAGVKGNKVNATLDALGLQIEGSTSMQPWCLTEKGKQYGAERAYSSGGHQGYEIKFKESVIDFIKENLHLLPNDWIKRD